jgi:hypothetical protein
VEGKGIKTNSLARAAFLRALLAACSSPAADPVVSNVRATQREGTKLVDIRYDVFDADGDLLDVTVAVSTNDGATFDLSASTFTGGSPNGYGPGVDASTIYMGECIPLNGQRSARLLEDAGAGYRLCGRR